VLTGSCFFDFGVESHRFHELVERAISEHVSLMLTWRAFAERIGDGLDPDARLLAAHEVIRDRQKQRRFRQAVFVMVHRHGDAPSDPVTLRAAIKIAGMDGDVVEEAIERDGVRLLDTVREAADDAGVDGLPAVVGGGPAVTVRLTPAATNGNARPRLDLIEKVAADDGIWSLQKP